VLAQGKFRTNAEKFHPYSVIITSDNHNSPDDMHRILNAAPFAKGDFLVCLGDMISVFTSTNAMWDSVLQPKSKLFARSKPLVIVRGNHELNGRSAMEYYSMFVPPGKETWYSFQKGDVLYTVLDYGYYKPEYKKMHLAQRKYLENLQKSDLWKRAAVRIALIHIPPSTEMKELFGNLFTLSPEQGGFDLVLSGHTHFFLHAQPGQTVKLWRWTMRSLPFPVIINDDKSAILMTITDSHIACDVYNMDLSVKEKIRIPRRKKTEKR
jgi:predicted phosphodiesterase